VLGLADHFVPGDRLAGFARSLRSADPAQALRRYAAEAPAAELAAHRDWIDHCYAAGSAEEIVERLSDCGEPAAKEAAETILSRSPTAVKVTLAAIRRARALGALEPVLEQEFRVSCTALASPDLVEGIRAQVIDKDRDPRWSPARLDAVHEKDVEQHFAPLAAGEPGLGLTD
jgi:enoyl-CoA hydratase